MAPAEAVCADDGGEGLEVALAPVPAALVKRFPGAQPFAVGSTSSLYRVAHGLLLKVFPRGAITSPAEAARLKRELQKQVQLQIAGMPKVVEYGDDESGSWLLREYVAGESLSVRLEHAGSLAVSEALSIGAQLASTVDDLHRGGLLHRDLKLGHILMEGDKVQLIDAGVVSPAGADVVDGHHDGHHAPELRAGKTATFRADLYSLGWVLHRLLTGQDYDGTAPLATDSKWPKQVGSLLRSLLADEPRQRPFSAQQVRRALDPFLPEVARRVPSTAPSVPAPARDPHAADRTQEISLSEIEAADPGESTQELELVELDAQAPVDPPKRPSKKPTSAPPPPPADLRSTIQTSLPPAPTPMPSVLPPSASPMPATPAPPPAPFAIDAPVRVGMEPEPELESPPPKSTRPPLQPADARARLARAGAEIGAALRRAIPSSPPRADSAPAPSDGSEVVSKARRLGEVLRAKAAEREQREQSERPAAPLPPASASNREDPTPTEISSDVEIAKPEAEIRARATAAGEGEISSDIEIGPTGSASDEVSSDVAVTRSEPRPPAPLPQSTAKSAFDVDSLFDDELGPERSLAPAPNLGPERSQPLQPAQPAQPVQSAIASDVPEGSQPMPIAAASSATPPEAEPPPSSSTGRSRAVREWIPGRETWPLLAAAGLLGLVVTGFAARACDPGDRHVAEAEHAAPPAAAATGIDAASRAAASPAPAAPAPAAPATASHELPRGASTPETAPAKTVAAAAEPSQPPAPAEEPDGEPSRTLTAAQARPLPSSVRGGVVQYRASDEPSVDYKARGRQLFSAKKFREAAEAYQQASLRTPSDAGAFAGLGASWLAAGQPERAIVAYQRALQLQPSVSGFQAALGRAYLQKGDRPRATAAYRKALELDPQNAAAKTALKALQP